MNKAASVASLGYRPDIDGLRGVAVLLVVLCHAGLGPFTGGFVGVDVFFVISGYLITSIVAGDLAVGRFTVLGFFERRARRILPALLTVIVACLVVGYVVLAPEDYLSLGSQAVYAALGLSNFYFADHMGYFDQPAALLPLLHTWSLGVEEQFYALWPLTLALLFRLGSNPQRAIRGTLIAVIAISFVISVYCTHRGFSEGFYMAYSRAWELGLGALLAFARPYAGPFARTGPALGLALILGSAVFLTPDTPFPGPWALPACLGTALVIWSGGGAVTQLLSTRPIVFVGLISYSLYLWHWPALVLYRHWKITEVTVPETAAILMLSVVLAVVSWRFIEQPFRRGWRHSRPWTLSTAAASAALVAFLGVGIQAQEGFPGREAALVRLSVAFHPRRDECFGVDGRWIDPSEACLFGSNPKPSVALWGDSHALALARGLEIELARRGDGFLFFGVSGCAPMSDSDHEDCGKFNALVLDRLMRTPEISTVVLAARWSLTLRQGSERELAALVQVIDALIRSGKHVVLVYQVPEPLFSVPRLASRLIFLGRDPSSISLPRRDVEERLRDSTMLLDAVPERPGLSRVYPVSVLCGADSCPLWREGKPVFRDNDHLSFYGSEIVGPEIVRELQLD